MSQILQIVHASAPANEIKYNTLELACAAWPQPLRFVQSHDNEQFTLETSEQVTFTASGFGVSLPSRGIKGNQDLQFQLDNVTGEAILRINDALEAGQKVTVIYRCFLDSARTAPAETPITMVATAADADIRSVVVVASFHDLTNAAWPAKRYTPSFAPGLIYS